MLQSRSSANGTVGKTEPSWVAPTMGRPAMAGTNVNPGGLARRSLGESSHKGTSGTVSSFRSAAESGVGGVLWLDLRNGLRTP